MTLFRKRFNFVYKPKSITQRINPNSNNCVEENKEEEEEKGDDTCERDEIGLLSVDHPPQEPRRVEIRASIKLTGGHISAPRHHSVAEMHVGDLIDPRIKRTAHPNPRKTLGKHATGAGSRPHLEDLEGAVVAEAEGEMGGSLDAGDGARG